MCEQLEEVWMEVSLPEFYKLLAELVGCVCMCAISHGATLLLFSRSIHIQSYTLLKIRDGDASYGV